MLLKVLQEKASLQKLTLDERAIAFPLLDQPVMRSHLITYPYPHHIQDMRVKDTMSKKFFQN